MPKLGGMAQLSRPFQIVLLAALALAMLMVTFMVLHRSGGTASSGGSSPSVASSAGSSASHAATHAAASGAGSGHVYHGPVPGLEGLTRDIKRAHVAAGKAERGVGYEEAHAGQTHGSTASTSGGGSVQTHASTGSAASAHRASATAKTNSNAPAMAKTHPGASATARSHAQTHGTQTHGSHAAATPGATAALTLHHLTEAVHLKAVLDLLDPTLKAEVASGEGVFIRAMSSYLQPASQVTVAAELKHGKTVLLLFLNPMAYDDDAVAIETVTVARHLGHSVAVHYAQAGQVNAFGSITREIQVYQTPTLLIVTPNRQVTTLTGLTDHYAIEQAVAEARGKTFNAPGQA
jgi:hypothetical protein